MSVRTYASFVKISVSDPSVSIGLSLNQATNAGRSLLPSLFMFIGGSESYNYKLSKYDLADKNPAEPDNIKCGKYLGYVQTRSGNCAFQALLVPRPHTLSARQFKMALRLNTVKFQDTNTIHAYRCSNVINNKMNN